MYGVMAEDALGRDAREVLSLQMSDEELSEALQEIEQTGRLRVEQLQLHKDGTPIHVDSLTIAMRDEHGETTGYLTINRDITERVRAEEVLRESGRRIENILESITEDFYAVDRELRFTYINERALLSAQRGRGEEIKREDLLGKNVWECFPEIVGTPFYHKYYEAMREQKSVEVEAYSPCVTPGMRCTPTHLRKACRYTSRTSPSASGQKRNCATTPTCLKTSRTRS
jgi:PAS domain S-box-containing protein